MSSSPPLNVDLLRTEVHGYRTVHVCWKNMNIRILSNDWKAVGPFDNCLPSTRLLFSSDLGPIRSEFTTCRNRHQGFNTLSSRGCQYNYRYLHRNR
jgi:hypothetical protein